MEFLSTIYYFLITIAVLVIVHEFGHFITAKMFGMRAEIFSVGFGKRLFGWNKIEGFSLGDRDEQDLGNHTDYRLSLLPLGGYVKIAGMIDESNDTDYLAHEAEPWEFRSKAGWKKAIVLSAGVAMNILLAIGIYIGVRYTQPSSESLTTTVGVVAPTSPAEKIGLKTRDKIISVGGKRVEIWEELIPAIYTEQLGNDITLEIEREGSHRDIVVPAVFRILDKDFSASTFGIFPEHSHIIVEAVTGGDPAQKAGFKAGDIIQSIDNVPIATREAMIQYVGAHAGKEIIVERVTSNDSMVRTSVTPNASGKIGVAVGVTYSGPVRTRNYTFIESIPWGFHEVKARAHEMITLITQLVSGKSSGNEFGGPIMIAQVASRAARAGAASFFYFMAALSLSLAFFNILPFPALDGGHLLFIIIEGVMRREVPAVIKIRIQQVGVAILLVLMAFIVYNDIRHF